MSKAVIAGWTVLVAGTVLWLYGYFATGHPSLIDWHSHTPWWIADYLPNLEFENRDGAHLCEHGLDLLAVSAVARRRVDANGGGPGVWLRKAQRLRI